jgi:hypothetical protein
MSRALYGGSGNYALTTIGPRTISPHINRSASMRS